MKNNVLCIGELLLDFVCTDKGVSLANGENFLKKVGGAPLNVAIAIKKLGGNPILVGCVGNDQFGTLLLDTLSNYEVDNKYIKVSKTFNTTLAFVSLFENGDRDFNFVRGADAELSFSDIDKKVFEESSVFHFGSATAFLHGNLNDVYYKTLELGVKNNKIITFDPNYRDALFNDKKNLFIKSSKDFIKYSDLVKVSDEEAMLITGKNNIEEATKEIIILGAKFVIVTLGSKGCILCDENEIKYIPTKAVEMVDATGAGDAFIGAIIAKISVNNKKLNQLDLLEYIKLGNLVGGLTVQKYGAIEAIPFLSEIDI